MRIVVLALNGAFDIGLTAVLDAFSVANTLARRQDAAAPVHTAPFDLTIVGMTRKVRSSGGLTVPVVPVTPDLKPDWVVVPALRAPTPELLVPALARPDVRRA